MALRRKDDEFTIPDYTDDLPPPIDYNPIPQTPPVFGGDGGPGVDVGSDPAGGNEPGTPFDSSAFARLIAQFGGGAANSPGVMSQILRSLGLETSGGGINGLGWLSLLGPVLGGILTHNATSRATDQMMQANKDALEYLKGQSGAGQQLFSPFITQGTNATNALAGMHSNLAANFAPLGSGRAITGAPTFADIMKARGGK